MLIGVPEVGRVLLTSIIVAVSETVVYVAVTVSATATRIFDVNGSVVVLLKTINSAFLNIPDIAVVSSRSTSKPIWLVSEIIFAVIVWIVPSLVLAVGSITVMIPG